MQKIFNITMMNVFGAGLVMPNSDLLDRFAYLHLNFMLYSYIMLYLAPLEGGEDTV